MQAALKVREQITRLEQVAGLMDFFTMEENKAYAEVLKRKNNHIDTLKANSEAFVERIDELTERVKMYNRVLMIAQEQILQLQEYAGNIPLPSKYFVINDDFGVPELVRYADSIIQPPERDWGYPPVVDLRPDEDVETILETDEEFQFEFDL